MKMRIIALYLGIHTLNTYLEIDWLQFEFQSVVLIIQETFNSL